VRIHKRHIVPMSALAGVSHNLDLLCRPASRSGAGFPLCGWEIPAVLNATGAVLDLGRSRRIASHIQTLALTARDGGCSFPGCDRAPQWCERHHIREWVDGGETNLGNLTLLCRYHHHNFAGRGWTCRINGDRIPEWTPPGWIDRTQTPLINTRIRGSLTARRHSRSRHPNRS
jgi:hypothetical protein